ncbi:MAG: HpcH/HpaI aldolase/citrate lyase family protein [Cellulomonadaceae bacterium]
MSRPSLTLLYAPASRPELVAKALAAGADTVIVDLEDAVAPSAKDAARAGLAGLVPSARRRVQVRINQVGSPWHDADVEAVAALPGWVGARVPKVESAAQVRTLAAALPGRELHLLLESAIGVERAFEIASAAPAVASIGLGEADLRSDLRVDDEAALGWVRSRVVLAARAAGLSSPSMSAYTNVRDVAGLISSCRTGRALGFLGRTAIHPRQLAPIREAFSPSAQELADARRVLDRLGEASARGVGAVALEDGTFLDAAMVERARTILALAPDGEPGRA